MRSLVLLFILTLFHCESSTARFCPPKCHCNKGLRLVNCAGVGLKTLPHLPQSLGTLNMDDNFLEELPANFFGGGKMEITEISVRRNNLARIADDFFSNLTSLRFVHLDENNLTSLPQNAFSGCPHLFALTLADNPLSEAGFSPLLPLPTLQRLDIGNTAMLESGNLPNLLSNISLLKELALLNTSITNLSSSFFQPIASLSIQVLDLSDVSISSADEDVFSQLLQLNELHLSRVRCGPQDLRRLLHSLNGTAVEAIYMNGVFNSRALIGKSHLNHDFFLGLAGSNIRKLVLDKNFAAFGGKLPEKLLHPLRSLVELHLRDSALESIPENAFQTLHNLKILVLKDNHLSCTKLSDCSFLNGVTKLGHLTELDLSYNFISDTGLSFTSNSFPELEILNLNENRIELITGLMFQNLTRLLKLDLSDNPITDIETGAFADLQNLYWLNLENCKRLSRLKQGVFADLTSLKVLNLQNCGLVHVHHALVHHLNHLEELYLRANRFIESKEASLNLTIKKSALKVLDLGENGLTELPQILIAHSPKLTHLHLDANRVSDCTALNFLGRLKHLELLDLSLNNLVTVDEDCFTETHIARILDLNHNNFYCTCSTLRFFAWMQTVTNHPQNVRCLGPSSIAQQNPMSLPPPSFFECSDVSKVGLAVGITLGIFIVLSAILLILFLMRRSKRSSSSPEITSSRYSALSEEMSMSYSSLKLSGRETDNPNEAVDSSNRGIFSCSLDAEFGGFITDEATRQTQDTRFEDSA